MFKKHNFRSTRAPLEGVTARGRSAINGPPRPSVVLAVPEFLHRSASKVKKANLTRIAVLLEMKLLARDDIRHHLNGNIEIVNATISSQIRTSMLCKTPTQRGLRRMLATLKPEAEIQQHDNSRRANVKGQGFKAKKFNLPVLCERRPYTRPLISPWKPRSGGPCQHERFGVDK